ncbi:MAG TPA: acetate uptake transporter [bacterium]|nr:acetate uptake transporter [bacterium]
MAEEGKPVLAVADPAPLGLGGFALTTFVLSAHNAGWAPDIVWIGLALFYGGAAQFLAGMWEFKNKNTFGATAFSTYGAFWFSLATFILLQLFGKGVPDNQLLPALGWFLLSFAIFNTYMMLWSTRANVAVFLVFLTLEVTEILLFIGFFSGSVSFIRLGGYVGIITALVAWYTSAAGVVNSMSPTPVLPVGGPLWAPPRVAQRPGSPLGARG